MSRNNEAPRRLTMRDKELVALGAAIASNCIPCIEYHVPQARKAGWSDFEIGEAVALAAKVRQIPADKVLQTASALLQTQDRTQTHHDNAACGCLEGAKNSRQETASRSAQPHDREVELDNERSKEDNEENKPCCGDDAKDSNVERNSEESANGSGNDALHRGFYFSKMVEMMQKCCPDRMKSFSSMMSELDAECWSPNEQAGSKKP